MARVYPSISNLRDTGGLNYLTDSIAVTLLSTTAAYNSAHQFLSSLVANEITGIARQPLANKAKTTGATKIIWSANNLTFAGATAGQTIGSLVVFKDGPSDAARPLIVYHDLTDTLTNGTDVIISWTADGVLFEEF